MRNINSGGRKEEAEQLFYFIFFSIFEKGERERETKRLIISESISAVHPCVPVLIC